MGYTKHTLVSGTTYSRANGIIMAFLKHVPAPNPNKKKHQLFIYLHGIDHCGPTPKTMTDYSTLDIVSGKGVALAIRDADLPYYQVPGGATGETRGTAVLAPQCSTDYASSSTGGTWPFAYAIEMIKYAENYMADVVDLNRISICGYSLGGGFVLSMVKDSYLNPRLASAFAVASGYNSSPDYVTVANSGLPMYLYHSPLDGVTNGSAVSDGFVSQMNLRFPVHPVQYINFADRHHNYIVDVMGRNTGFAHLMTTGDTYIHRETIYQTALRHTRHRAKR